jgi:hypothetical protein
MEDSLKTVNYLKIPKVKQLDELNGSAAPLYPDEILFHISNDRKDAKEDDIGTYINLIKYIKLIKCIMYADSHFNFPVQQCVYFELLLGFQA